MPGEIGFLLGNASGTPISVSPTNPLPVTIGSGNLSIGSVNLTQVGNTTFALGPQIANLSLPVVQAGDNYVNLSADGLAVVKATPGVVKNVTVNTKGTVASTVTIKDGANTVAIIDSLNLSGAFTLNATCTANITATLTGTVAPNVTVTYQ